MKGTANLPENQTLKHPSGITLPEELGHILTLRIFLHSQGIPLALPSMGSAEIPPNTHSWHLAMALLMAEGSRRWGQWEPFVLCERWVRLPSTFCTPSQWPWVSQVQPHPEVSKKPKHPCEIASIISKVQNSVCCRSFNLKNANNVKKNKKQTLLSLQLMANHLRCAVLRSLSPCSWRYFCFAYAITNTQSCSHQLQHSSNTLM